METIRHENHQVCSLCGARANPLAGYFHQEDHTHAVCFACFTRLLKQGVPAEARVEENGSHLFHRQVIREAC